jgi:hypothetical protein
MKFSKRGKPLVPRCPDSGCGAPVNIQKCPWELGTDCPRHPLKREYDQAMRKFEKDKATAK